MDTVERILINIIEDPSKLEPLCDHLQYSGTCKGVECGSCMFNTIGSVKRNKNYITNRK